ncbi:DUF4390 domain-containing protein [Rhodoferax aquaticus]|uniref:DUF4390 domain-containing protein n=1 Tax=Rhodoferax aquaticus TaxID=2527691 RepID=A0A515EUD5_9BURK|nr:DUF4390 domain-containing protein [Rhodoferax aquaticus]QDL56238.1 DUF4390 domain-containing protein [Rhodoferax aquaticus]
MTVSITHSCKSSWAELRRVFAIALLVLLTVFSAKAQVSTDAQLLRVERVDDEVSISTVLPIEIPSAVEEALQKGLPLFFIAEAELVRERWYWYDKRVVLVERHTRLAFQPLTRKWRVTVSSGPTKAGSTGLSLNQNFETLSDALGVVRRVSRWKIADVSDLDPTVKYKVDFRFRLDLSLLPLPFQIGTLGQTDWDLAFNRTASLPAELSK